jgi:hypothetical protein
LDLAGERGLSDSKPLCGASVVLILSNRHEIAQMSQFHTDTLSVSVQS